MTRTGRLALTLLVVGCAWRSDAAAPAPRVDEPEAPRRPSDVERAFRDVDQSPLELERL